MKTTTTTNNGSCVRCSLLGSFIEKQPGAVLCPTCAEHKAFMEIRAELDAMPIGETKTIAGLSVLRIDPVLGFYASYTIDGDTIPDSGYTAAKKIQRAKQ